MIVNMTKCQFIKPKYAKLNEFAYLDNDTVSYFEHLLCTQWFGDDVFIIGESAGSENTKYGKEALTKLEDMIESFNQTFFDFISDSFERLEIESGHGIHLYIVNHHAKEYIIQKNGNINAKEVAALPVLLALGNNKYAGSYHGHNMHLAGIWINSIGSIEPTDIKPPQNYRIFNPDFYEKDKIKDKFVLER